MAEDFYCALCIFPDFNTMCMRDNGKKTCKAVVQDGGEMWGIEMNNCNNKLVNDELGRVVKLTSKLEGTLFPHGLNDQLHFNELVNT